MLWLREPRGPCTFGDQVCALSVSAHTVDDLVLAYPACARPKGSIVDEPVKVGLQANRVPKRAQFHISQSAFSCDVAQNSAGFLPSASIL